MESIGDKLRGLALAVGVHALAFALLFLGLSWTQAARPVSVPGPIIEATLASYTPPPTARIPVQKPQPPRPRPEARRRSRRARRRARCRSKMNERGGARNAPSRCAES